VSDNYFVYLFGEDKLDVNNFIALLRFFSDIDRYGGVSLIPGILFANATDNNHYLEPITNLTIINCSFYNNTISLNSKTGFLLAMTSINFLNINESTFDSNAIDPYNKNTTYPPALILKSFRISMYNSSVLVIYNSTFQNNNSTIIRNPDDHRGSVGTFQFNMSEVIFLNNRGIGYGIIANTGDKLIFIFSCLFVKSYNQIVALRLKASVYQGLNNTFTNNTVQGGPLIYLHANFYGNYSQNSSTFNNNTLVCPQFLPSCVYPDKTLFTIGILFLDCIIQPFSLISEEGMVY